MFSLKTVTVINLSNDKYGIIPYACMYVCILSYTVYTIFSARACVYGARMNICIYECMHLRKSITFTENTWLYVYIITIIYYIKYSL